MRTPEKIYLQVCGDCPQTDCEDCKFEDLESNITWCKERIFPKDVEYTRTDALSKENKESWNERLDKKDFRERYKRIAQSESFKKAYEGISIGDVVPVEGGEPVSKELEEASLEYWKHQLDSGEDTLRDAFKAGAKWQFERVNEALLSDYAARSISPAGVPEPGLHH